MSLPFVISLPHCSHRVPREMRDRFALTDEEVLQSTDLGTEEIFGGVPAAAVVRAAWSRLVADLNRGPGQRDARGVIARLDYYGRNVYREGALPSERDVQERLEKFYYPFHKRLEAALDRTGATVLFDCHSLCATGPPQAPDAGKKRRDITLGNNGGASGKGGPGRAALTCPKEITRGVRAAFEHSGFSVSVNDPYSGGYITKHYGERLAKEGKWALQVEINQHLFLEPGTMGVVPERLRAVRERVLESFLQAAEILR